MPEPKNTTATIAIVLFTFAGVCVVCYTVTNIVVMLRQPVPVAPSPERTELAELVDDPELRAKLSAYFGDFAETIRDETKPLKTLGEFREAYKLSRETFQSTADFEGQVAKVREPVQQRLEAAVGLEDHPLDGEPPLRTNLANVLDDIAADFGGR